MTYLNAKKYIHACPDCVCDKDRFNAFLLQLGSPQKSIKHLRLAGSNGKTVCAEMLMSVMSRADYNTGCLRMPARQEPRDNICIGSKTLSMNDFANIAQQIKDASKVLDMLPSRSEALLLIALCAFKSFNCDLCIIECDHFGNDPSVLLPPPFAAVICGAIPSDDSKQIARIRSYVCKGISEIVSVPQNTEAYRIISDACYSISCRLTLPAQNKISIGRLSLGGTEFSYKDKRYSLSLCGRFQVSNAVLLLETVEMLSRKGFNINQEAVRDGLASLKIPAKFEVLSISPLIIVDSTHTPVAIDTVCSSLEDLKAFIPNDIRLCLPSGKIIDDYISALSARGYAIEDIITNGEYASEENDVTVFTKANQAARLCLSELDKSKALLISGEPSFVLPIRYELLGVLGF
ncbi:MAG: hypothetical protein J6U86_06200 [Clostridia bacterium]|nr:hypothetical protein [Clostridia bacterium]